MEIGDLVKRRKPFPEEKDQLWLITNIEDIEDSDKNKLLEKVN